MRRKGDGQMSHGESGWKDRKPTPEFQAWKKARARCQTPSDARYASYGGRGIRVCDRWQKYENFLADMGRRPSPLHSLDRIDNDGNYEPGNCRWATASEQQRNMRNNNLITAFGETLCMQDWVKRAGIDAKSIKFRLEHGWTPEEAVSEPRGSRGRVKRELVEEVPA
jgi:hypothetical protein